MAPATSPAPWTTTHKVGRSIQELLLVNVGTRAVTGMGHTWDLSFARMPTAHLADVNPADRFYRREAVAATRREP